MNCPKCPEEARCRRSLNRFGRGFQSIFGLLKPLGPADLNGGQSLALSIRLNPNISGIRNLMGDLVFLRW